MAPILGGTGFLSFLSLIFYISESARFQRCRNGSHSTRLRSAARQAFDSASDMLRGVGA